MLPEYVLRAIALEERRMCFNNSNIQARGLPLAGGVLKMKLTKDDVIELERENYLFAANMKSIVEERIPETYIFKWINGNLKFLYRVDLVSGDFIKDQIETIADKFFKNKEALDHDGYSEDDIFQEMQKKGRTS